jgi:hypothetical protein
MYTIEQIWKQAKEDTFASNLDGAGYQARIVYGCRIVREDVTGEVQIYNTGKGGDYYKKVHDVNVFLNNGWRYGCYEVSLDNYRDRLDRIEKLIKSEMNGKKNPKQIQSYKTQRESVLNKYAELMVKLNKLKSNGKR